MILATIISTVALFADIVTPAWTNHNRIAGSQNMMTNFQQWAESVQDAIEHGGGSGGGGLVDYALQESENIAANMYRGAISMRSLYSPTNIEIGIGSKAFAYLPNLTNVCIGRLSAAKIYNDSFRGCNIESLVISNAPSGRFDGTHETNPMGLFGMNKDALRFVAADIFQEYSQHTFNGCGNLKKVDLMNKAKYIGQGIFTGCTNLEEIVNTDGVKVYSATYSSFSMCKKLKRIVFDDATYGTNINIGDPSALEVVSLTSMTNLYYQHVAWARNLRDCRFGLVSVSETDANWWYDGDSRAPDEEGVKTRFWFKNSMNSIKAVRGFPFVGMVDLKFYKFICHDGYMRYESGAWVNHPWSSVAELPVPGHKAYVYDVDGTSYKWNQTSESYEIVTE